MRKEAVLSSQIEGTRSALSDLLLFESDEVPGVPLDDVREVSSYIAAEEGDWEGWPRFFLVGVLDTAEQAVETARSILQLFAEAQRRIKTLGRATGSALRVHQLLQTKPMISIPHAAHTLGMSAPTVATALRPLQQYIQLLDRGTEPLP